MTIDQNCSEQMETTQRTTIRCLNKDSKIAILISGRGSNMQSILAAAKARQLPIELANIIVISSNPNATGLNIAHEHGVITHTEDRASFENSVDFENAIVKKIEEFRAHVIVLAGFMWILSKQFVQRFQHRIINIHPALLPMFPGLHAHKQAIEHGVKITGCTVHFVVPEVDAGPIILQKCVPVEENDTEDSLAARVLGEEHKAMVEALQILATKRIQIQGRTARIVKKR